MEACVCHRIGPQTMNNKLDRVSFMREPGRKLFIYDSISKSIDLEQASAAQTILPHRSQSDHDWSVGSADRPGRTEHIEGHIPHLPDRTATISALRRHCGSHCTSMKAPRKPLCCTLIRKSVCEVSDSEGSLVFLMIFVCGAFV